MQVTYRLLPAEFLAYCRFMVAHDRAYRGPMSRSRSLLTSTAVSALVVLAVLVFQVWHDASRKVHVALSSYLAIVILCVWGYASGKALWQYDRSVEKQFRQRIDRGELGAGSQGEQTLTLTAEGVCFSSSAGSGRLNWGHGIEAIAQTQDLILLYAVTGSAFIVPVRAFPSADAAKDFVRTARQFLDASGGSPRMQELQMFLAANDAPCPSCGYGLRGLIGDRCPECGLQIARQDLKPRGA